MLLCHGSKCTGDPVTPYQVLTPTSKPDSLPTPQPPTLEALLRPAGNRATFLSPPRRATAFSERPAARRHGGTVTGKSVSLDAICLQFVNSAGKRSPDALAAALAYLLLEFCLLINEFQYEVPA